MYSNLMENIFMNTVSKLIYLKNDIVTYMNFIYVTISLENDIVMYMNFIYVTTTYHFSSISVYFSYK